MARTTTYYGLNISEGNDPVNPLVDIFPNFEDLDSDLKDVSDAAVGTATELTTGTVHALTRSDTDRDVFLFVATSNFEAGETFTLDGVQVTALTPDGQPLATGSYVIGSVVLCALQSTLLTVYVNPAKAKDSDKLDGQHGTYYATASDVTDLGDTVTAISNKVGSAVLTTTAPDCSGAINELNSNLTFMIKSYEGTTTAIGAGTYATIQLNYTRPSYYHPIGIMAFNSGNTMLEIQEISFNADYSGLSVRVGNHTGASRDAHPTVKVLFAKSGIVNYQ